MDALQFFPLFWIKSAGTWAIQSCEDTAEGNWLSQRPGNCFRNPWVIILFCSWKASVGYKSSLNRVSELQICQSPNLSVCAREPVREERLWALNIAFVPELMSVFLFCKKLYLLRLWLCSDKAALHFSEGSRGLNEAHPVLSPLGGAVPLKTVMPDSRTPPYLCTEAGVCLCRAPAITVVYMTFSICCSLEWKPAEINYNAPEVFTCKWAGILELRSSMTREAS